MLKQHRFSGQPPIEVLGFLRRFKVQCDFNGVTEGAAALFLPEFLAEPARSEFLAYNNGGAGTGGLYSYPKAVSWLLARYAKDRYLEPAIEAFDASAQGPTEDEHSFGLRLQLEATQLAGAHSEPDLVSRLIRGFDPTVKPLLTAERVRDQFGSCQNFEDVVERARTIGDSHRALLSSAARARGPPRTLSYSWSRPPVKPTGSRGLQRSIPINLVEASTESSGQLSEGYRDGEHSDAIFALDRSVGAPTDTESTVTVDSVSVRRSL